MPSTHTSITRKRGGVMRLSSLPSQRYSVLRVLLMTPLPLNQKGYSSNTVQTSLRSFSARRAARASRSSSVGKRKTLSQRVDEVKAPQGNGTGGLGIREKRAR